MDQMNNSSELISMSEVGIESARSTMIGVGKTEEHAQAALLSAKHAEAAFKLIESQWDDNNGAAGVAHKRRAIAVSDNSGLPALEGNATIRVTMAASKVSR